MLISGTIGQIADNIKTNFNLSNGEFDFKQIISFIEKGFNDDGYCPYATFEDYKRGFLKEVKKTPNKNDLIKSEIDVIEIWIYEAFGGNEDYQKIVEIIEKSILINREKLQILSLFTNYCTSNDIAIFVSIVYGFDLIKYRIFLNGDPLEVLERAQPILKSTNVTTYDFFDEVLSGELGDLDIYEHIQNITSFDSIKLEKLLKDIEYCFFVDREETESEYSKKDVQKAIKEREEKGLKIPMKKIPIVTIPKNEGEIQFNEYLDIEALFFPFKYFGVRKLIKEIKGYISKSNDLQNTSRPLKDTDDNQPESECLRQIITHAKSTEIVDKITVQYKNIKGKRLKILLIALQSTQLLPQEQIAAKFHRCCNNEFSWNIASYTAMNDYRYNSVVDESEYTQMIEFLKAIINPM